MADATYNPQPFVSNPMSSFDPTQWANPYSPIPKGQGFPWPSQYAGPPTDAFGNPIQSYVDANNTAQANYQQQLQAYNAQQQPAAQPAASGTPGTTLNSSPAAAGAAGQPWNYYSNPTGALPGQPYSSPGAVPASAIPAGQTAYQVYARQPDQEYSSEVAQMSPAERGGGAGAIAAYQNLNAVNAAQQAAAPAAAGPPTPPDMSAQYIRSLANPGPLRQVGANVPANAATTQPGPGVLQQFLANWQPQGGSGPGSQFTQAFSKALRGA